MTDFKDQMSSARKGVFASMSEAPTAAAYGVGPMWIGGVQYWSDGATLTAAGGSIPLDQTGTPGSALQNRYVFPPDTAQARRRPNDPGWAVATGYTSFPGEDGVTKFIDPVLSIGYNAHTATGKEEPTVHGWAYVLESDYYSGQTESVDAQQCEAYIQYTRRQGGYHRPMQFNVCATDTKSYTITGITAANPCVVTVSKLATDLPIRSGQSVSFSSIAGTGAILALNGTSKTVIAVQDNSTSVLVTIEHSATGGTYTSGGTATVDFEGVTLSSTLRTDSLAIACGTPYQSLVAHSVLSRHEFYQFTVDNRKVTTFVLGNPAPGASVTVLGGALLQMRQAGQNAASTGVGSGVFEINLASAVSGANNPSSNGVYGSFRTSNVQAIGFLFNAYGTPSDIPCVTIGGTDGLSGLSQDTTYSSNSMCPRLDVNGSQLGAGSTLRTLNVRAGRNSTGDLALFQSQNNAGGKNYFRVGNNAELILRNPPATPANPLANEIALYWNGTNLVYRDSAGTVKTITAT